MKKVILFLAFLSINLVFSQDSIDWNKNKKIIYEIIISDFQKEIKNDTLFVNIDFNQEIPDKTSTGILGNRILSTSQINTPFRVEFKNSKIYSNLSFNFHEIVGKEKANILHRDIFHFMDIKSPIDKWLSLNFIELLGKRAKDEAKIFIPVEFEKLDFKNSIKKETRYFYEFKYTFEKGIEFIKKTEF
ncbi:hypothetical protein [Flavobacterium urocaniciphilum]|uniref:Uncharacterized protein n=1 Tax=Flavobacterium urocaniciphilum TaxID=1299341 RepID=A0A1H9DF94_9FLAO|nr:hypothetical protein [Flavobacterium urocaniciphilum]SEQ11977.1 hypothetical protein SAMN05444005_1076 [Flavobacterium urocaniciphilum]